MRRTPPGRPAPPAPAPARLRPEAISPVLPTLRGNLSPLHVVPAWGPRVMRAGPVTQENKMDKDRVEGSAKNIKGKAKDQMGKALGDSKMRAEGKADQMEGKIQNTVGGVKDKMREKD